MRFIRFVFFLLAVTSICFSCKREVYIFSYFKNNGQDGLHLAYSSDGFSYTALKRDSSFLKPEISNDKLMRDPHITQDAGGRFHMVWTVSWNAPGIGYAWSDDLIHWSEQQYLPVMEHETNVRNSWAPETFFNNVDSTFTIFWASTITGRFKVTEKTAESDYNHRMYYTTTKDFQTFTPTKLFFDQGFNVIDATIIKPNNEFYLIVKDETKYPEPQKNIRITSSHQLLGPYMPVSKPISENWVEGPSAVRLKDGFIIYYDQYTRHKMGAIYSEDLVSWSDISSSISFPDGTRHGTVFKIKKGLLKDLLKE